MSLTYDPQEAIRTLKTADAAIAAAIDAVGPCTLVARPIDDPFEALLRAIVYQQLSGKAAATIYGRVVALFPDQKVDPSAFLTLADDALRGAGLSRQKLSYAKDLAAHTLDGVIPSGQDLLAMADDEIQERLCHVKGVGRWTVEMLLIFNLGRPDVLPTTDLGVRKGFSRIHALEALPAPKTIEAYGERWRPYRSVASWYLWRILEQ